jgi:hypothetical protein
VDDAELEKTLRDHLEREKPNPERVGCPAREEIRTLVCDPHRGDRTINDHLTVCSECFGLYQRILTDRSTVPSP